TAAATATTRRSSPTSRTSPSTRSARRAGRRSESTAARPSAGCPSAIEEHPMEILQPDTWDDALALKAAHPEARPIQGGTDLMVELNFDRTRPPQILDLNRVAALREWDTAGAVLRVGSGVTYTRLIGELGDRLPGLAIASRTVGSPQIRNRGTVGGNLATASPAGDGLPPLFAADAVVEVASVRGSRRIPVAQFVTGPKRNTMAGDELIAA